MSILRIENLSVSYGNIKALKGISLRVEEGEVVSLIGANGAGKTTTLQTISGLLAVQEGDVYFNDKSIKKKKAFQITREGLAQVPEGRRVFKGLSVEDNLKLGSISAGLNPDELKAELEKIYKLFPVLKERKNQKAGTLSGGEQQMLAMGRALLTNPKVLLLDEPSMGLSPLFVDKIFETIRILKEEGRTILLVEQNANLALDIADRAYVLETGKIVKEGKASDLKSDPDVKAAYLGV
ncbi:ABC transporter ATP-binding protein [Anaerococcus lactolyticus]|uniref:ABC transporter, ATP-binding protein n=2 Tax=Anaerococcus lactolyticus TaxID=33032 RepID=C2BDS8_9FIRM|nr:ABC transporter, ATP-binding protein [Anaerococcus lactolyticus ATCC 51172]KGF04205.1 amino acid ABC transporter ATPase [Anaerococcus lactolyticus S7-1-13]